MSLKDTLTQIIALQSLSRNISNQKKDRDLLHDDVEEQQKLIERLSRRMQEVKEHRIESQKAGDALELKTKEAEDTNAKLEVQLNTTKHQRDYDLIRQSIASHMADIAKWEDEELELLQQVDESRDEKSALTKQLEAAGEELQQIERRVAEQAADYERRISELQQREQALQDEINPTVLKAYQRVVAGRGRKSGLVEVKRRICQGCFTTITKQAENDLLRDVEIVYCDSCGRILMLAEGEEVLSENQES